MSVLKNLIAKMESGITGPLLVVKADANQGSSTEKPKLKPAMPPGFNPTILLLTLENGQDEIPENWVSIEYTRDGKNNFKQVSVTHKGHILETVDIEE